MKFSTASIAALSGIAIASANEFNLRSTSHSSVGQDETVADVRVSMHGLLNSASQDDMDIISKAVVNAFNHAYTAKGSQLNFFDAHTLVDFTPKSDETLGNGWSSWGCRLCPDDDSVKEEHVDSSMTSQLVLGRVGTNWSSWGCRLCPDDDSLQSPELGQAHKAFEDSLCSSIRSSGSTNLANIHGCSFSFLQKAGDSKVMVDEACASNQYLEAQLTVSGLTRDFTEQELQFINKNVRAAYNEAFMREAGMAIGFIESIDTFNVASSAPTQGGTKKIIAARVAPLCPNGGGGSQVDEQKLEFADRSFENALCTKLQKSGLENMAGVRDCSFRWANSPVADDSVSTD